MSDETHPLIKYLRGNPKSRETVSAFASRLCMSRTHLYRIINGGETTTRTLQDISDATGGKVSVEALLKAKKAIQMEAAQ